MSTPAMTSAPSTAPSATPVSSSPAPTSSSSSPSPSSSSGSGSSASASSPSPGSGGGDPGGRHVGGGESANPAEGAATSAAVTEAKKEEIRRHKLKVNGKEMEMEEPEVLRRAQLAESAQEKFQEAATIRKQAAELVNALKTDPLGVLKYLGVDTRSVTEKYLAGEIEREMMTPEQREMAELREYREKHQKAQKDQELTTQQKAQQAEAQAHQQRAAQEYDTKITEALSQSNLPKTAETVKRVASLLFSALQKGYELDPQTAADMVRQQYMGDVQAMFGGLKGEALIKVLGPALAKEIRQHDLAQIKKKLNPEGAPENFAPQESVAPRPRQQPAEKSTRLSQDEWLEKIRLKAGV